MVEGAPPTEDGGRKFNLTLYFIFVNKNRLGITILLFDILSKIRNQIALNPVHPSSALFLFEGLRL